jgi:gas vesicle protein
MSNSNNNGKLLGAVLVGAAIGGILGVLFAPEKGSDTRNKLMGKADDLSQSLKKKFNDLIEESQHELEAANNKAKDFAEKSKI